MPDPARALDTHNLVCGITRREFDRRSTLKRSGVKVSQVSEAADEDGGVGASIERLPKTDNPEAYRFTNLYQN